MAGAQPKKLPRWNRPTTCKPKRWWVRLHEKGGERHEMPVHHKLEAYIDEYIAAAGIRDEAKGPLFRSAIGKTGVLTTIPHLRRVLSRRHKSGTMALVGTRIRGMSDQGGPEIMSGTSESAPLMSAITRCRRVNLWLACKRLFRALPGRAGGAVVETTVDHTLMRGSEPHDR
jgi:hypothetical protein